jgi:hypothetical protein
MILTMRTPVLARAGVLARPENINKQGMGYTRGYYLT